MAGPLSLPPLPPWEGLHPLVVHFPIALLLVAPIFVLLGLLPNVGRGFALAALVLMALGSSGAYVAVASGEAAARLVVRTPEVVKLLERHEDLAEASRLLFTILTLVYALLVLGPLLLKRPLPRRAMLGVQIIFVAAYLTCSLVLANTGSLGGRLVHELGVQVL
jgi:uncharacterized membrane protein